MSLAFLFHESDFFAGLSCHYIIQVQDWHKKAITLNGHYSMYSMGHDHEMILKITKLNEIVVKSLKTKFMQFDFPSTICLNLPLGVVGPWYVSEWTSLSVSTPFWHESSKITIIIIIYSIVHSAPYSNVIWKLQSDPPSQISISIWWQLMKPLTSTTCITSKKIWGHNLHVVVFYKR